MIINFLHFLVRLFMRNPLLNYHALVIKMKSFYKFITIITTKLN